MYRTYKVLRRISKNFVLGGERLSLLGGEVGVRYHSNNNIMKTLTKLKIIMVLLKKVHPFVLGFNKLGSATPCTQTKETLLFSFGLLAFQWILQWLEQSHGKWAPSRN